MAELKVYIDNERELYDEKVKIFKKIFDDLGGKKLDVNKYPSWVLSSFTRLITKAKRIHQRSMKEYYDGEPDANPVTLSDETDALKELVHEYNVEVVELKNYSW